MKKKIFLLLAVLAVMALVFAACEDVPVVDETTVSTEAPTDPAETPAEGDTTHAPTDSATDSATDPETDPVTDPVTDPETDPETDPQTDPATDPETDPETDPATEPETEPATEPETEPGHVHAWVNATCTAPKTCSSCGATEGEALGHTEVVDAAVAATCTTAGKTEGKHCSVCNEVIVAQSDVAALGHEFYNRVCKNCNGVLPTYTAWDANKDVVSHQSFDQLYLGSGNAGNEGNFFTPGQAATWNKIAVVDASVSEITYWGWCALVGEIGQYGYQIDCDAAVFNSNFTWASEQPVLDAGGRRMKIVINLSGLTAGVHTVNVLYKNTAGNTVALNTFRILILDEAGDQATTFYSASDLVAMSVTNATATATDGYVHIVSTDAVGGKNDPIVSLSADGASFSDFIVIKYRTNGNYGSNYDGYFMLNGAQFIGNRANGNNTDNVFNYVNDNEWHYLVLDLRRNRTSGSDPMNVDVTGGAEITSFEYCFFDYAGNKSGKNNADDYIDIAYIAFY